jgi:putative membrane protein
MGESVDHHELGKIRHPAAVRIAYKLPVMSTISAILVALVGLLHAYFLVLEMFLWTKPVGRRAFGTTQEQAEQSKVLAANQGLYNGFLSAGLFWSLTRGDDARAVATFFLACVIAAGLFGAATASRKILWVQALPAVVALGAVWVGL